MYHLLHVIVVLYKGVKGQELSKRLAAKFKSSVYVPRLRLQQTPGDGALVSETHDKTFGY